MGGRCQGDRRGIGSGADRVAARLNPPRPYRDLRLSLLVQVPWLPGVRFIVLPGSVLYDARGGVAVSRKRGRGLWVCVVLRHGFRGVSAVFPRFMVFRVSPCGAPGRS